METQFPIHRILDDAGQVIDTSKTDLLTKELSLALFTHMNRIRTFDRKAINLQRQGRLGTYAPFEGQEAAQVGSAYALHNKDWVFPTYRDHGATLTFGADMVRTFLYWNGRVEGCVPTDELHIFPPAVPIATQIPHAVGAAWAEKRKGTNQVAVAYFGDGATSEGDFHEGMNFASVFQAPVILFNQNNGYAISVPIQKQMHSETIAQKALAYGMPSVRIDGNDVFAVYFTMQEALERARSGGGPTLIEAVTWRFGAHTTADDPSKYRDQDRSRDHVDPLTRLEDFMKAQGFYEEQEIEAIRIRHQEEVEAAVKTMEAFPSPDVNDLFDHTFATLPDDLIRQKADYLTARGN
ncbi:pyruvate dehydrogenase (acetyl-transferring) E1 component subunit alpha [Exiguobacterium sp. RIT452]|uniref:pyruvate dehydrogenase (acetyl-transferring) E1 component subunit alpha n=1 Tax=Exiguobacterium sp. RIT452 TaxID=2315552 RepID=UPI000E76D643|nr:pyruvate dehydrogenase (acetyl-transferring) E1 component subunit alpha [Exiguobacterium sp. RIT452]RJO96268.1 pyruvate dehydrogenase (acetyl-transferring) E1 component subunit alpha [Exiguobacterium sp. RIT452]